MGSASASANALAVSNRSAGSFSNAFAKAAATFVGTDFRARVTAEGWLVDADLDAVDADVLALIDRSVTAARSAAPPTEADMLTDVYVNY